MNVKICSLQLFEPLCYFEIEPFAEIRRRNWKLWICDQIWTVQQKSFHWIVFRDFCRRVSSLVETIKAQNAGLSIKLFFQTKRCWNGRNGGKYTVKLPTAEKRWELLRTASWKSQVGNPTSNLFVKTGQTVNLIVKSIHWIELVGFQTIGSKLCHS